MDKVYNSYFFNDFYEENGGGSYLNKEQWTPFFDKIAEKIIENFAPRTVLDAGCALGYIVKALRDRGVEAYGVDISEYAVSHCDESIKDFMAVGSITDPLPKSFPEKFDLIITIEVLEHLFPEDGKKAIARLCSYTDTVIFTSTPDDTDDRTHCNVQLGEYWAKIFAENSFYHDLLLSVDFICPWAMLFRRKNSFSEVVFDYELNRRIDGSRFRREIESKNADNAAAIAEVNTETAYVYFELPEGLSEKDKIAVRYKGTRLETGRIGLPPGCKAVRLDPVENKFALITGLTAAGSSGSVKMTPINACYNKGGAVFFANSDPQIFSGPLGGMNWIEINCFITLFSEVPSFNAIKDILDEKESSEKEFSEFREQKANEIRSLNAQREREINSLNAKRESEISSLNAQRDREISELNKQKEREIKEINEQKKALEEEFSGEKSRLEDEITALSESGSEKDSRIEELSRELATYKEHYSAAIVQRDGLSRELSEWQSSYSSVVNSTCWKMTAPERKIMNGMRKTLLGKGLISLRHNGVRGTWRKIRSKYSASYRVKEQAKLAELTKEEREAQIKTVFPKKVKFSILVPLYNTPLKFLEEMVASVEAQTYGDWELCLADGSDAEHKEVGKLAKKLASQDKRIKYKKLEKNLGISENTNACIDMSTGDYISLFDHDDILHPSALYETMKMICERDADFIYTDEAVFESPNLKNIKAIHYKCDYAPDTLRSLNYITHFSSFSRKLMDEAGRFRSQFDGSQDHDITLRLTSRAHYVAHIPKVLYYWRAHPQSVAHDIGSKSYAVDAGRNAVLENVKEMGYKAVVESTPQSATTYRIKYEIRSYDKVSIIIPNKDHLDDLKKCIDSIKRLTTYPNYEVIIIDNGSSDKKLFSYYDALKKDKRYKVFPYNIEFNYSKINNFAAERAKGKYLILLNNDIEIITPEWIEEMLMFVQRDDVGAAGAMLYYPDDTIQHAGIIMGLGGLAAHAFWKQPRGTGGYLSRGICAQDLSAVTAACMMVKASVFKEVGGLDEENFKVAYNDVDLCMKIREKGYLIVWTPFCEAYHFESKSRGYEDTPEKLKRFEEEKRRFRSKWKKVFDEGDPYYNPNLTLDRADFSFK